MNVAITGIHGFIGQNVKHAFEKQGHAVFPVPREALLLGGEKLDKVLNGMDVVINLAGAAVTGRWTERKMIEILESRRVGTRNLVRSIERSPRKPGLFINASAVGIYRSGVFCDEEAADWGNNFLSRVVRAWEDELNPLHGVRKVVLRFGMVLGKGSRLCRPFTSFLGLHLAVVPGNGKQEFPLIHVDDIAGFMQYVTERPEAEGIYNLVIPHSVTYSEFVKVLTKSRKSVFVFRIPEWLLKARIGGVAEILIRTPRVIPMRLLKSDYVLKYRTINEIVHSDFFC